MFDYRLSLTHSHQSYYLIVQSNKSIISILTTLMKFLQLSGTTDFAYFYELFCVCFRYGSSETRDVNWVTNCTSVYGMLLPWTGRPYYTTIAGADLWNDSIHVGGKIESKVAGFTHKRFNKNLWGFSCPLYETIQYTCAITETVFLLAIFFWT